jgi:hypothetical protein
MTIATGAAADLGVTGTQQQQAIAKLDSLGADPAWLNRLFTGDGTARKEFDQLVEAKFSGDKVTGMIEGTYQPQPLSLNVAGVSDQHAMNAVGWMRNDGHSDAEIEQLLRGQPVSKEEYDAALQLEQDLVKDRDFARLLGEGNREAARTVRRIAIIKTIGAKAAA